MQCNDVIQAMAEDTANEAATLYVDGGVAQSDILLQMQADCAGIEVARPADVETTALGAAVAAGLGSGVFGLEAPPLTRGRRARPRATAGARRPARRRGNHFSRASLPSYRARRPERAARRPRCFFAARRAEVVELAAGTCG